MIRIESAYYNLTQPNNNPSVNKQIKPTQL